MNSQNNEKNKYYQTNYLHSLDKLINTIYMFHILKYLLNSNTIKLNHQINTYNIYYFLAVFS